MACGMDYGLFGLTASIQQELMAGSWNVDQYFEVTNYMGTPAGFQQWTFSQGISHDHIMGEVLTAQGTGWK